MTQLSWWKYRFGKFSLSQYAAKKSPNRSLLYNFFDSISFLYHSASTIRKKRFSFIWKIASKPWKQETFIIVLVGIPPSDVRPRDAWFSIQTQTGGTKTAAPNNKYDNHRWASAPFVVEFRKARFPGWEGLRFYWSYRHNVSSQWTVTFLPRRRSLSLPPFEGIVSGWS